MLNSDPRPGPRRIFRLAGQNLVVLLAEDDTWGFEANQRFYPTVTAANCMPLLPLLERSYADAVAFVQAALTVTGAGRHFIQTFPFEQIVQCALRWETSYWPTLAAQWLESGYPLSESCLDDLQRIAEAKHYDQNLRQRARQLVQRAGVLKSTHK